MPQYNKEAQKYVDRNNDLYEVVMLADKSGNFLSSNLINEINISNGLDDTFKYQNVFGAVPEMPQNGSGSVWDINGTLYPFQAFNTAGILSLFCFITNGTTSFLDNGKIVTIIGLDEDYNEISENIIISNGTGTGSKLFKRVNRAYTHDNLTNIDISIHSTVIQKICIGKGTTLNTNYTIPSGYTGFITQGSCTCSLSSDATVDMYIHHFGNGFINGHSLEVSGGGGQYLYKFTIPVKITEKSDIDVRAAVRTNKARITVSYDLIIMKNEIL
jgi:hypothetical protein